MLSLDWLSKDGKLILSARIARAFAYGFLSIIIGIYLKLAGFSEIQIGIVLSATLVNSVIFTLLASFYADRIGRKKILIIYGILMGVSGAIFLATNNFVALIVAALIGTINVTGSETGAFLSIEQSVLPQTVNDAKKRTTAFAIYNTVGTLAMAAGVLLSGLPEFIGQAFGFGQIDSIKPLFLLYSVIAVAVTVIYFLLSKNIELRADPADKKEHPNTLSAESKKRIGKLSALFAVDSFAGGFVIQSIVSYWFFTRFGVDLPILAMIFSIAGVLTALSFLAATKIAGKIGLINTMVTTHIASNVLLILVAFAPIFPIALGLYLARMSISQMDVPTRQSYIVAIVNDKERTAAAGITNTSRNIAQAVSPSITGMIIQSLWLSAPFVIGGVLKIAYDIGLYVNFRKIKPAEETQ
ncbi:MFS transporter [Candidatus Nitrosotenuis aquarius]|uniref:MFS transporter n=1 Tax=Candidatus Nitrosotenuis aquarius TaxID=1846278 RepID=UPI000C1F8472|nr:MFS transporter [Candidatus Nitrosotenuis aquarius]